MENLQSISFFSSDDSFDKKQAWNTKMTERSTMRDVCVDFRERGRSYVADLTFIYHLQRMFETLRLWVSSLDISQSSFLQVVGSFIESDIRAHFCLQVQRKIFTICLIIFQHNISKNISICYALMGTHCWNILSKLFAVKMKRAAPNNLRQSRVAIVAIVASSRFLPFRNSMGQNVSRQQLLFRQHACSVFPCEH